MASGLPKIFLTGAVQREEAATAVAVAALAVAAADVAAAVAAAAAAAAAAAMRRVSSCMTKARGRLQNWYF